MRFQNNNINIAPVTKYLYHQKRRENSFMYVKLCPKMTINILISVEDGLIVLLVQSYPSHEPPHTYFY
jgi:hypothetical protein